MTTRAFDSAQTMNRMSEPNVAYAKRISLSSATGSPSGSTVALHEVGGQHRRVVVGLGRKGRPAGGRVARRRQCSRRTATVRSRRRASRVTPAARRSSISLSASAARLRTLLRLSAAKSRIRSPQRQMSARLSGLPRRIQTWRGRPSTVTAAACRRRGASPARIGRSTACRAASPSPSSTASD
jgi:hypothetical protein